MSMVRLVAVEPVNRYRPGEDFETTEREANLLVAKGLAKMAVPVTQNKMTGPTSNKANPSPAAGEAQQSSASQAARVSPPTTATPSATGRPRGRPRKTAASSR